MRDSLGITKNGNGFVAFRTKRLLTILFVFSLLIGAGSTLGSKMARADDPDFLSVGAGWFDWNREKDVGACE